MEIMCPDCFRFLERQMNGKMLQLRQVSLIDIIPYGFAYVSNENFELISFTLGWEVWTHFLFQDTFTPEHGFRFHCQHGPQECYGNMILTCAREHLSDHQEFIDFTLCFNHIAFYDTNTDLNRTTENVNNLIFVIYFVRIFFIISKGAASLRRQAMPVSVWNSN